MLQLGLMNMTLMTIKKSILILSSLLDSVREQGGPDVTDHQNGFYGIFLIKGSEINQLIKIFLSFSKLLLVEDQGLCVILLYVRFA